MPCMQDYIYETISQHDATHTASTFLPSSAKAKACRCTATVQTAEPYGKPTFPNTETACHECFLHTTLDTMPHTYVQALAQRWGQSKATSTPPPPPCDPIT
jgi:hypothetical protein